MPETLTAPGSLTERKRRHARQRIIEAADELFAANGFDNVSVTDIAARAEVGRTTFFRYFGDKAEVVFAREQEILETITDQAGGDSVGAAVTLAEAIDQLRPIVLDLCDRLSANAKGYALHYELIEKHSELRERDALKTQRIAHQLSALLIARGTDEPTAVLAGQIALACCQAAQHRAKTARTLTAETRSAFDQVASLGSAAASHG